MHLEKGRSEMKIAIVGIDFPLGKKNLEDERLEKLRNIVHTSRVTEIQINFEDSTQAKEADGIICDTKSKLDLILQDLEIIENRLAADEQNKVLLSRAKEALEKEILLSEVPFSEEEKKLLLSINLITLKPITFADKENLPSIPELTHRAYSDCGMITFFTANERELRAWVIKSGTTVYDAAGSIHSDIQRGFIKAEVINYAELIKIGSLNQAKAKGAVRLEDKAYIIKDGDFIQIRFNV